MNPQREWIANAILVDDQKVSGSKILEDHLNDVWMRGVCLCVFS